MFLGLSYSYKTFNWICWSILAFWRDRVTALKQFLGNALLKLRL